MYIIIYINIKYLSTISDDNNVNTIKIHKFAFKKKGGGGYDTYFKSLNTVGTMLYLTKRQILHSEFRTCNYRLLIDFRGII